MRPHLLVAAFAPLACTVAVHANLLVNGSFEMGNYDPTGDGWSWNSVPAGDSTKVTGWTAVESGFDWHRGVEFGPAYDGDKMIDLTYYGAIGGIAQQFATVQNEQYVLTFALAGPGSYEDPREVWVSVAGQDMVFAQATTPAFPGDPQPRFPLQWAVMTMSFTAVSDTTTLAFRGDISNIPWGPVIDDVKVMNVTGAPEAGMTMGLLGLSASALLALRRRAA